MKAVELFAGAGGLGMGLSLAGFKPEAVVEWDHDACETLRANQLRGFPLVRDWPLQEGDVRKWIADFNSTQGGTDIDIVAGPLLTLIVYNRAKPELKRDVSVVGLLQLAFLGYGLHTAWVSRPIFLVGAVDRFTLI